MKPLTQEEFIPALAKIDPVYKDEFEQFKAWATKYNKQGKPEEKPKDEGKGKGKKDEGKKKKK